MKTKYPQSIYEQVADQVKTKLNPIGVWSFREAREILKAFRESRGKNV